MNKKRLSVVMAGAMLASSVAPVLAADANKVETSASQKGALANELAQKLWKAPRFSDDKRVESGLVGKSVYAVVREGKTITDTEEAAVIAETDQGTGSFTELQNKIKALLKTVAVGEKVKLVNLGSRTVTEKVNGKDVELVLSTEEKSTKYTEGELEYVVKGELDTLKTTMTETNYNKIISSAAYDKDNKKFVIEFNSAATKAPKKIELTTESNKLDFTKYNKDDGQTLTITTDDIQSTFVGFPELKPETVDIKDTDDTIYTITAGGNTYELSDLYDAPFLKEAGQNLLDSVKDAKRAGKAITGVTGPNGDTNIESAVVRFVDENRNAGADVLTATAQTSMTGFTGGTELEAEDGVYKVRVDILNAEKLVGKSGASVALTADNYDSYYVTSKSRADIKTILEWINEASPNVDVLEGEDRYATAVKIAKEAELELDGTTTNNIVLVNGNSLVDGLAAAPLAGHLSKENSNANTPILLTEAGKLPSATKRYLKELVDQKINKNVTVHIVGGEGVVSNSIVRELKDMNLKVERYAGEDRHETSMAVAKEIGTANGAFVVGAEGEADAMSISGYAASKVAPVIVSGFDGLSEDALDEIDGSIVTVIGGDSKVSKAEYERISSVAAATSRISGTDRKATNAAVINKFYKNSFAPAKSVLVAKDDVLVDALTAANLSSKQGAPIVLATKELSKEQINAVVDNAAKTAEKVYQIGGGVAPSIVKTVAEALNLI